MYSLIHFDWSLNGAPLSRNTLCGKLVWPIIQFSSSFTRRSHINYANLIKSFDNLTVYCKFWTAILTDTIISIIVSYRVLDNGGPPRCLWAASVEMMINILTVCVLDAWLVLVLTKPSSPPASEVRWYRWSSFVRRTGRYCFKFSTFEWPPPYRIADNYAYGSSDKIT